MSYGYHGRILHVNLTDLSVAIEKREEDFYRLYAGGSALGMYYLLKNTPPRVDPFRPENTIILATSIITGIPVSGCSRLTMVSKSPLSGVVGDSQVGGFFPKEMKCTGYDAFVITGRSEKPVYLSVNNEKVEFRSAVHLMGLPTAEIESTIIDELGDKNIQIVENGIAGENKVRFASVMHMANRAFGRTGMGAVMGSKNLKAIAVKGNRKVEIFNRKIVKDIARWGANNLKKSDLIEMSKYGTASSVAPQNKEGGLPSYNFRSGYFKDSKKIDASALKDLYYEKSSDTCYGCIVHCKRVVKFDDGKYNSNEIYGGPEYETIACLGSYCGISNLKAICHANQLCSKYGIDTISCGGTIAWAMECYENGIINKNDTDGVKLTFGNSDALIEMIEKIARRDGFGNILAEGSAKAAKIIGKGAEKFLVTVKDIEVPAHMPQVKSGLGIVYAVNPFGPDHNSSAHDPEWLYYKNHFEDIGLFDPSEPEILNDQKAKFAYITQNYFSALDSLNLCCFAWGPAYQLYHFPQVVKLVKAVTGWQNYSIEEIRILGERRINMMRVFNAREGRGKEWDLLPKKMFIPLEGGESNGKFIDREEMKRAKDQYYKLAGWDNETGNPSKEKLDSLGIGWIENCHL
jgi:aldehyde:ferredoxin oxidoreductase